MKNNKAITLIVLVITIIILLILAGITIATLTNSGLFSKSQEAKEKWENAQEDEEIQITKYSNDIDSYVGMISRFSSSLNIETIEISAFPFTVPEDGFLFVSVTGSDGFYIHGASVGYISVLPWGGGEASTMGYVKKGDILSIAYNAVNTVVLKYIH